MPWTLTCGDLFDRDSTPSVQATGSELLAGLMGLWKLHLREGLQEDGQRTLCCFDLRWGVPPRSADVDDYLPHHAAGAPKLRRWLLSGDAESLLSALASAHLRLLERGGPTVADRILEVAAHAEDRAALDTGLKLLA